MNKKPLSFQKVNSIVYKEPQHHAKDLKPFMKNLELRMIVVQIVEQFVTKQQRKATKFLMADQTGSIYINIYDDGTQLTLPKFTIQNHFQDQEALQEGHIIYINGAYATSYKDQMIINQGKNGLFKVIGEFFIQYVIEPNYSTKDWSTFVQNELK